MHDARVRRHVFAALNPQRIPKRLQGDLRVGLEGRVGARAAVDVVLHVPRAEQALARWRGQRALLREGFHLRGQQKLFADEGVVRGVAVAPAREPDRDAPISEAARPLVDLLVGRRQEEVVVALGHDLELPGRDGHVLDQVAHQLHGVVRCALEAQHRVQLEVRRERALLLAVGLVRVDPGAGLQQVQVAVAIARQRRRRCVGRLAHAPRSTRPHEGHAVGVGRGQPRQLLREHRDNGGASGDGGERRRRFRWRARGHARRLGRRNHRLLAGGALLVDGSYLGGGGRRRRARATRRVWVKLLHAVALSLTHTHSNIQ